MKKVCLTILLIIVMMLSTITIVNATDGDVSATFKLSTTNTDVKVGDIVKVTLSIEKIEGFEGIDTFIARKQFDATIFEYQGAEAASNWEVKGDSNNITFKSVNNVDYATGEIGTFTFKVLKPVENTTISLINLDVSGDNGYPYWEDGNVNSPSVSFKITEVVTPDPDPNPTPDPDTNTVPDTDTNTTPDTNTNKVPDTNTNKVNNDKTTASGGKIPQTGESYVATALVVVGIILVGIFYTKYKMYDNKMK